MISSTDILTWRASVTARAYERAILSSGEPFSGYAPAAQRGLLRISVERGVNSVILGQVGVFMGDVEAFLVLNAFYL